VIGTADLRRLLPKEREKAVHGKREIRFRLATPIHVAYPEVIRSTMTTARPDPEGMTLSRDRQVIEPRRLRILAYKRQLDVRLFLVLQRERDGEAQLPAGAMKVNNVVVRAGGIETTVEAQARAIGWRVQRLLEQEETLKHGGLA